MQRSKSLAVVDNNVRLCLREFKEDISSSKRGHFLFRKTIKLYALRLFYRISQMVHRTRTSFRREWTYLFLFSLLVLIIRHFLLLFVSKQHNMSLKFEYSIYLDGGSSGTRVHVFRHRRAHWPFYDRLSLPEDTLTTEPGLSSYWVEPEKAGPSLSTLIEFAHQHVPPSAASITPVYLFATAGLRLLDPDVQDGILESCRTTLRGSGFLFEDNHVAVIEGKDEGLYGWTAVNYVAGTLQRALTHQASRFEMMDAQDFYGILEMGGASMQVTFIAAAGHRSGITSNSISNSISNNGFSGKNDNNDNTYNDNRGMIGHANRHSHHQRHEDPDNANGRPLHLPGFQHNVFSLSFLGMGMDAAAAAAAAQVKLRQPRSPQPEDPCLPNGFVALDGRAGRADWHKCLEVVAAVVPPIHCANSREGPGVEEGRRREGGGKEEQLPDEEQSDNGKAKRRLTNLSSSKLLLDETPSLLPILPSSSSSQLHHPSSSHAPLSSLHLAAPVPCTLLTHPIPKLRGRFVAMENFYWTAKALNLSTSPTLRELALAAEKYCSTPYDILKSASLTSGRVADERYVSRFCFGGAYIFTLLHSVLRIGLDEQRLLFTNSMESVESREKIPMSWVVGAAVVNSMQKKAPGATAAAAAAAGVSISRWSSQFFESNVNGWRRGKRERGERRKRWTSFGKRSSPGMDPRSRRKMIWRRVAVAGACSCLLSIGGIAMWVVVKWRRRQRWSWQEKGGGYRREEGKKRRGQEEGGGGNEVMVVTEGGEGGRAWEGKLEGKNEEGSGGRGRGAYFQNIVVIGGSRLGQGMDLG